MSLEGKLRVSKAVHVLKSIYNVRGRRNMRNICKEVNKGLDERGKMNEHELVRYLSMLSHCCILKKGKWYKPGMSGHCEIHYEPTSSPNHISPTVRNLVKKNYLLNNT